jgi:hypothetical protein
MAYRPTASSYTEFVVSGASNQALSICTEIQPHCRPPYPHPPCCRSSRDVSQLRLFRAEIMVSRGVGSKAVPGERIGVFRVCCTYGT